MNCMCTLVYMYLCVVMYYAHVLACCLSLICQQISALQTVVHGINETLNQAVALSSEEFNEVLYTLIIVFVIV